MSDSHERADHEGDIDFPFGANVKLGLGGLAVDLAQARVIIEALTGSADTPMTFQTFDDAKRGRPLARVLHGTLDERADELRRLNALGAGVFVMVNEGDGVTHPGEESCRTEASVVAVRALFTDHDAGPPDLYALQPSFRVQAKRGPQAYWLLEPGTPRADFKPAQKQLAAYYGSDDSINDLPRVMRLPGFYHRKAEPFLVNFLGGSQQRYTIEAILAEHPLAAPSTTERPLPIAPGAKIPVGRRREAWKTLAAQLHNDGTPYEQKVTLMMAFAAEMFEQPETAQEADARGIAEWYELKEARTPFTVALPPAPALEPPPDARQWPKLGSAALYGLAGEIVKTIDPHTEADPVAVLVHLLVMFGNSVDRGPHVDVGASWHFANLFAVVVGNSSVARKGTAKDEVRRLFRLRDEQWEHNQIRTGLSTGEGLIHAVRDPEYDEVENKKTGAFETKCVDKGVDDKRLLALQTEFASVLKVAARESNPLSEVVRDAWDGAEVLQIMTRRSPVKATAPHISIIGHSTSLDLQKHLSDTEAGNGFGNRFLWVCARRSRSLPHGGTLSDAERLPLAERLWKALDTARGVKRVIRDAEANELWEQVYPDLCKDRSGLYGALTSRAEAQVLRLSLVYALLDQSKMIRLPHLEAALALWDYCDASVRYIFGDAIGDKTADKILSAIRRNPGLARAEVNDLFKGNVKSQEIDRAVALLERLGRITTERVATPGRTGTRYFPA